MKKNVAIVFGVTKDFTFALANVLIGMRKHCRFFWDTIIVYHDGITENEQACLNAILPCEFIVFDETVFVNKAIYSRGLVNYSLLTLARFECFSLLENYHKVIWHDVDILVQSDFSGLLQYGEESGFAATQSPTFRVEQNFFGLLPGYDMFSLLYNAGILVLTDKLPNPNVLHHYCYDMFNKYSDRLRYNDQSVLNMMIQDYQIKVEHIDLDKYCCHPTSQNCTDAVIIHAYGVNKFWNSAKLKSQFPEWGENNREWGEIIRSHKIKNEERKPTVSVIMSVFNRTDYLNDSILSILDQTFIDFELIIVIEKSEKQDEIYRMVSNIRDNRIVAICNEVRLGFPASLNVGIDTARGKYIARMDDDDISEVGRLYKQVEYLDNHSDISVVGTWMKMFGQSEQKCQVPESHSELLVWALKETPLYHPTVMMRKLDLDKYGFRYNPSYFAEDYELWSRLVDKLKIANIQEYLYKFRASGQNVTAVKQQEVLNSHISIMKRTFRDKLGLEFSNDEMMLLRFPQIINECYNSADAYNLRVSVIRRIIDANKKRHIYDNDLLIKYLGFSSPTDVKMKVKTRLINHHLLYKLVKNVYKKFTDLASKKEGNKGNSISIFYMIKMRILPPSSKSFHNHINLLEDQSSGIKNDTSQIKDLLYEIEKRDSHTNEVVNGIKDLLHEIEKRDSHTNEVVNGIKDLLHEIERKDSLTNETVNEIENQLNNFKNRVPYVVGEKIRVVFLFQIPSFWPSWDTFVNSCLIDSRIDVKVVLYPEIVGERSQLLGAEQFLLEKGIKYVDYLDFSFEDFKPHVVVIQTPFDEWHRLTYFKSESLSRNGFRILYIPYGIEIGATNYSKQHQFNTNVINTAWRVFTISNGMKREYHKYSLVGGENVRVLGHPKFDKYYTRDLDLPQNILNKSGGKKIIVWKIHFPLVLPDDNGSERLITPNLEEYVRFSRNLCEFSDFFFLVLPHPKIFDKVYLQNPIPQFAEKLASQVNEIMKNIENTSNAEIYKELDYRPALFTANAMIIDRSAALVEAGALDVPILYLHNADFNEPLVEAVEPLINSYYQGTGYKDIEQFLFMCREGRDPQKEQRETTFKQCVPLFDGKAGYRIKEDLVNSLLSEKYPPKNN